MIFSTDSQTNSVKNDVFDAVKKDDIKTLKKLFRTFSISPLEEISQKGNYWSILHYCCCFQSLKSLEFLLSLLFVTYGKTQELINALNVRTVELYNPAMVAVVYKSDTILEILLKHGGLDLSALDLYGDTIFSLARKYYSTGCENMLEKETMLLSSSSVVTPFKEHILDSLPSREKLLGIKEENNDSNQAEITAMKEVTAEKSKIGKYRELLLNGNRSPCMICLGNGGHLLYSTCCGQPYHKKCFNELENCIYCNSDRCFLQEEVIDIEKAFFLL